MTTEIKQCAFCKEDFLTDIGRKGRKKIYCSKECSTKYHNKNSKRTAAENRDKIAKYFQDKPEKRFLASTKSSAKKRNLVFDLTETWFKERIEKGVCEVTGLPIRPKPYQKGSVGDRGFYSPSIDRIDNNIGYIESNCRLVCWGYNLAKNKFTDRDLNALSLSILLRYTPKGSKSALLEFVSDNILSSLPSGHSLL